ncbi:hypothetical protein EMIHUDRAFT_105511 [Emiliania huxleyi CCMP1516]|uniref:ABC transporter domain-containing protein n=2 Tax=Emiliania huxleyi TaxID=2903 RepID=A0A0D3IEU6_EMIH1|nr:hypothetical protein EMIHUDRAFT_105511 [Emiliania huxleyi CCMP1516]EOD09781.1 hypothetical protein EMIHUDRAFT_105511 [Emiliania huxleyi CCMP1516]|eukprot:XP_005762210.1 hypothetical protein EMIHUDRAFT_105511 [Emiliania huxleyi CCMP1516]
MDVLAGRKTTGTIVGEVRFNGATCLKKNIKHLCGYVEQFDNLVEARKAPSISTRDSGIQHCQPAYSSSSRAVLWPYCASSHSRLCGQVLSVEQMLMYTAELKLPALTRAQKRERVEEVIAQLRLEGCRKTVIGGELVKGISGGQKKRVNIGLSLITRPPVLFLDEPTTGLDSAMADEVCAVMSLLAAQGRTVVATIHSPTASAFSLFDDLLMLRDGQLVYAGECGDAAADYFSKRVGLRPLEMGESMPEWLAELALAHGDGTKPPVAVPAHLRRASPLRAILILLKYRALTDYRDPVYLGPRIGDKLVFSLIVLTLYLGEGGEMAPAKVAGVTGILFMVTALCGYGAASVEGFLCVFTSLLFTVVIFWGVQFQGSFFILMLSYYLVTMISIALAYAIASLAPTLEAASAMLPTYVTTVMFVAGLIMLTDEIPSQWAWYGWTSFIRYGWAAMMNNQFQGHPNGEAKLFLDANGTAITVLDFYGLRGPVLGDKWACIGMLVAIFAVFFTCGLGVLSNIRHERR